MNQSQQARLIDSSAIELLIDLEKKIFLSNNNDSINHLLINKALVYKDCKQLNHVIHTLERVSFNLLTDSLKTFVSYELSLASFLQHNYQQSIAYANQCMHIGGHFLQYKKWALLMIILSYNELEEYDKAQEYSALLIEMVEKSNQEKYTNEMEILYSSKSRPKHKNPAKAETMSAIIPGLGQVYSGYYAEGIANFALHALLLSVSGYAAYETYYLTSYFAGINMLIRFYQGGTRRSMYLANKRNYINKQEYNYTLKAKLIEISQSN
jgi:hypothetical protein